MPVLLEYEAKQLLHIASVPIPEGDVIDAGSVSVNVSLPRVVKSQVPIGGRGKAGGIVVADTEEALEQAVTDVSKLPIQSHLPKKLLLEEKLSITRELYLSILIDRAEAQIVFMAHTNGGVEVEDNDKASFLRLPADEFSTKNRIDFDQIGQKLADYYDMQSHAYTLQDIAEHLYECFVKNDATLIEINPLVLTDDAKLIAGDCKMTLDDAALFRHKEWDFETPTPSVNFVTLDPEGDIATIANGAGLAMATVDSVTAAGLTPANFLDIGGGANEDSVKAAFRSISDYKNVKAIIINIFAGITRCDEVAKAIIGAKKNIPNLPPLFIRLEGTNVDQAKELLSAQNIPLKTSFEVCIEAAKGALRL